MRNLGVKEAAAEIRDTVLRTASHIDPEDAHRHKFLAAVCGELGIDASPDNLHHVFSALREHDIAIHAGHEYPKYVTRKYDNTSHIANDADEEDAIVNAERPAPVDQPRVVDDGGSFNTDLDLKDKVPHTVKTEHPAGRAPDEQTNRAASQDPALFNSDANATHDHNPATDVHTEEVDSSLDLDDDLIDGAESSAPLPEPVRKPLGERKRPL